MNQRDQFIQEFVRQGQTSGATQQQVEEKLATAIVEFDKKYPIKKQESGLLKLERMLLPQTTKTVEQAIKTGSVNTDAEVNAINRVKQEGRNLPNFLNFIKESFKTDVAPAAELAALVLPGQQPASAATRAARVGQSAITGAEVAGLQGFARGVPEDRGLIEGVKAAPLGALTGAAFQYGGEKITDLSQKFNDSLVKATKKLNEKGYTEFSTTLKDNKSAQEIIRKMGGPEKASKTFIEQKIPKTKNGVIKELEKMNSEYDKQISGKLKTIGQTRNIDFDSVLDDAINQAKNRYTLPTPKDQRELDQAIKYIESFRGQYTKPQTNLNNMNELRKKLDVTYSKMPLEQIMQGEKFANDTLANNLRQSIQSKAPITQSFFKRYSTLRNASEIFTKEPKLGMNEALGALAGSAISGGNLFAGIAGLGVARVIKSPGVYRGASTLMTKIPQVTNKVVTPTNINPYISPAIKALQNAIENERQSKTKETRLL